MKAQAYYDDPKNMIVRIFPSDGNGIADLPLNAATPDAADHALKKIRLRRNSPWRQTTRGREATVYFANEKAHAQPRVKAMRSENQKP